MPNHTPLLLSAVLLAACGADAVDETTGDLTQPLAGRCAELEGLRFETADPQTDCGPAPAGTNASCRWRVSFAANDASSSAFVYLRSDVGDAGRATCTDGVVIELEDGGTPGISGAYDMATGFLEWEGVVYRRVP